MRHTKAFLQRCEALWRLGVHFPLESQVARGFADLGFEEFMVLPGGKKIISILTGTTSELPDDAPKNLFAVPSPDEALSKLSELGALRINFKHLDERSWELTFVINNKEFRVIDRTLQEVLVEGLIQVAGFD